MPGFEPGTVSMWDQNATSALFLSLSPAPKKLVFINGAYRLLHFFQQIIVNHAEIELKIFTKS